MNTPHFNAISFETACVDKNYPYWGRLKCEMRFFVEFRKNRGWRPVTQSINPKTNRLNAPHPGVYSKNPVFVVETSPGFFEFAFAPSPNSYPEKVQYFINEWWTKLPIELKSSYNQDIKKTVEFIEEHYPNSENLQILRHLVFPTLPPTYL